jgi:hypothetical protein
MAARSGYIKNTAQESPCLAAATAAVNGLLPIAVFGFNFPFSTEK